MFENLDLGIIKDYDGWKNLREKTWIWGKDTWKWKNQEILLYYWNFQKCFFQNLKLGVILNQNEQCTLMQWFSEIIKWPWMNIFSPLSVARSGSWCSTYRHVRLHLVLSSTVSSGQQRNKHGPIWVLYAQHQRLRL